MSNTCKQAEARSEHAWGSQGLGSTWHPEHRGLCPGLRWSCSPSWWGMGLSSWATMSCPGPAHPCLGSPPPERSTPLRQGPCLSATGRWPLLLSSPATHAGHRPQTTRSAPSLRTQPAPSQSLPAPWPRSSTPWKGWKEAGWFTGSHPGLLPLALHCLLDVSGSPEWWGLRVGGETSSTGLRGSGGWDSECGLPEGSAARRVEGDPAAGCLWCTSTCLRVCTEPMLVRGSARVDPYVQDVGTHTYKLVSAPDVFSSPPARLLDVRAHHLQAQALPCRAPPHSAGTHNWSCEGLGCLAVRAPAGGLPGPGGLQRTWSSGQPPLKSQCGAASAAPACGQGVCCQREGTSGEVGPSGSPWAHSFGAGWVLLGHTTCWGQNSGEPGGLHCSPMTLKLVDM